MGDRLDNFKKAIQANPRLSNAEKRTRIEKVDRLYAGHIARAERTA